MQRTFKLKTSYVVTFQATDAWAAGRIASAVQQRQIQAPIEATSRSVSATIGVVDFKLSEVKDDKERVLRARPPFVSDALAGTIPLMTGAIFSALGFVGSSIPVLAAGLLTLGLGVAEATAGRVRRGSR